jgi:lysozyme
MQTRKLLAQLEEHEGFRSSAYSDSEGWLTIGIGRLIDSRKGGGITKGEALYLLENDVRKVTAQLDEHLPWWSRLDEVRQRVIADMGFNLGITGLLTFKNTLRLIQEQKYELAADAMLASRWATQVGRRAIRLSEMMRTGQDL